MKISLNLVAVLTFLLVIIGCSPAINANPIAVSPIPTTLSTFTPVPPTPTSVPPTPTPLPPPVAGYVPEGAISNLGRGFIYDTAVSPDGSQIALGSVGGTYILDGNDYHETIFIPTENSNYAVNSLGYTPDGKYLLVVSTFKDNFEQYLSLYDAENFSLVRQTFFPRKADWGLPILAISPTLPLAAVTWKGQNLNTWDYEADKWNYIYNSTGNNFIRDSKFAPNGDLFLSDNERVVSIMAGGGKFINKYDDLFESPVIQIAISHSGTLAAGYSQDALIVWGAENGTAFFKDNTLKFYTMTQYSEIFFSEDDKILYAATRDGLVQIDTQTGRHIDTTQYSVEGQALTPLQIEPLPGNRILHVFTNFVVAVENLESGQLEYTSSYFTAVPSSSDLSADGARFATANRDSNTITIYDVNTGTQIKTISGLEGPFFVNLSPQGTYVHFVDKQGHSMVNIETGERFCIQAGLFSADESLLYYKNLESMDVASTSDCKVVHSIKFTGNRDHAIMTNNFQYMIENKSDGTINVYNVENEKLEITLTGFIPENDRYVLTASDDGRFIVLSQSNPSKKTWAWDRETGEKVLEITADNPTFSGHIIYTWSDRVLNIWDMDQNKALTPVWLPDRVTPILSPDGRLLAYSIFSNNKPRGLTIQVMDTQTSRVISTFTGHTENLRSFDDVNLYFSANSQRLVSIGTNGSILLWDVSH